MNREIKFRAWDKERKVMDRWDKSDSPLLTFEGEIVTPDSAGGTKYFEREYILMQYTGLKDKNGKEIYEGDIIEEECRLFKAKIVFYCGAFFAQVDEDKTRILLSVCAETNKIIGNIYENPELLKTT